MAIVINGSGTVTGLAVGGLPDGTVDAGTLATDSVSAAKIAANSVDSAELIDGSIDTSHIAANSVNYLKLAAGSIIQTVHMVTTRSSSTSSTSTSDVHLNNGAGNYTLAITPKFSNSYIMGIVSLPGVAQKKNGQSIAFTVYKNNSSWQMLDSHFGYHNQGTGNIHSGHGHFATQFIDTNVGSTNATTYDVRAKGDSGCEFRVFDDHIANSYRTHFTLMEIKQ